MGRRAKSSPAQNGKKDSRHDRFNFLTASLWSLVFDRPGEAGWAPSTTPRCGVFAMWGLFTAVMFIAVALTALQIVFATLMILFSSCYGDFTGASAGFNILPYEGIFCGFSAISPARQSSTIVRILLPLGLVKVTGPAQCPRLDTLQIAVSLFQSCALLFSPRSLIWMIVTIRRFGATSMRISS